MYTKRTEIKTTRHYLLGIFQHEKDMYHALKKLKKNHVHIHEVYSPYPIHGIEKLLGYKRSRLPIVSFLFGLLGFALALTMQYYMLGIDWPMNIGGKNFTPLPSFIPVTFELTVLFAALGMVGIFFFISKLYPFKKPLLFDKRITDDKIVIAINLQKNKQPKEMMIKMMKPYYFKR